MKVVLTKDVKKIGQQGEVVDVSDGYAQNFLIAKKLAVPAKSSRAIEITKQKKTKDTQKKVQASLAAQAVLSVKNKVVHIAKKANDEGGLYDKVGVQEIFDAVKEQHATVLPEGSLVLEAALATLGEHTLSVVSGDARAKLKVVIERE